MPSLALCEGDIEIRASGKSYGIEAVGVGLAEAKGALTDRAGRAEEGYFLHLSIFSEDGAATCEIGGEHEA